MHDSATQSETPVYIYIHVIIYPGYDSLMLHTSLVLTFTYIIYIHTMDINSTDESDFQYVSPAGSLTLSPTTTQRCVDIEILEDSELEDTEFLTVSLSLTSEQNSVSLSPQYANVSIIDKNGELEPKFHTVCALTCFIKYMCINYMLDAESREIRDLESQGP